MGHRRKPNQAFIVAPDEIVSLSAIISDNLPFEKLFQEASVNLGPWVTVQQNLTHSEFTVSKSIEHPEGPAFSAQADWAWDLGSLGASADDLRSLLLLWAEADREAKPILDEARATLAKYSPTVSELAKQAAVATQELKQLTEQLENDANRSGSIPSQDRIV